MAKEGESGEKTEDATPRRQDEAREKGQVAISTELISAISLLVALGSFLLLGEHIMQRLGLFLRASLGDLGTNGTAELDSAFTQQLMQSAGDESMSLIILFASPLMIIAGLIGFAQVGFHITTKAVELDPTKVNPVKGLERMFSIKSVVRTLMAFAKLVAIGGTIVWTIMGEMDHISMMDSKNLWPVMDAIGTVVLKAVVGGLVAIAVIGFIDLVFQRWQHNQDLLMTKQEVKEESKNSDGDPHVKARIRTVQREIASRRMMADVPDATVVVTNPTHYAVALKYEQEAGEGHAPYVVAKGVDHVAQQIKKVAAESGVTLFENVPLARALHAQCEIGDEVPEELFEAVASVLAYVYRVQGEAVPA